MRITLHEFTTDKEAAKLAKEAKDAAARDGSGGISPTGSSQSQSLSGLQASPKERPAPPKVQLQQRGQAQQQQRGQQRGQQQGRGGGGGGGGGGGAAWAVGGAAPPADVDTSEEAFPSLGSSPKAKHKKKAADADASAGASAGQGQGNCKSKQSHRRGQSAELIADWRKVASELETMEDADAELGSTVGGDGATVSASPQTAGRGSDKYSEPPSPSHRRTLSIELKEAPKASARKGGGRRR